MQIKSNWDFNKNNVLKNSKNSDESSLWDTPFKVLLKEVDEFIGYKMKKFKEELVLNKETGKYEKKMVPDEEAYKELLRLKLEEENKQKMSSQISEKINEKISKNKENEQISSLSNSQSISYMQMQAEEKFKNKNTPAFGNVKKQDEKNKNLFDVFSAAAGSSF